LYIECEKLSNYLSGKRNDELRIFSQGSEREKNLLFVFFFLYFAVLVARE